MSKAKGYPIGIRIRRDSIHFEYRDQEQYVRRTVPISSLTSFLTNGIDRDSNLGPGAQPMTLAAFLTEHYLPKEARRRLPNEKSFQAEVDLVSALKKTLGTVHIHKIRPATAEDHKAKREGCANNTIKKELRCLGRAMGFAVTKGLIKENLLLPVTGLPGADRSAIWLKLHEIDRLIECCPEKIVLLVEFMILTGARIGEALLIQADDVKRDRGLIMIPTEKRRKPPRECMRSLNIKSLGPRFAILLPKLKPHGESRLFFPISYCVYNDNFIIARKKAKLDHVHGHDLRGTFCVHRALVINKFRELQRELGHRDAKSVDSYLGRAEEFDPKESIFFIPPETSTPPATTPPIPPVNGESQQHEALIAKPHEPLFH